MDIFLFCLETTIPYKRQKLKVTRKNRWLSKAFNQFKREREKKKSEKKVCPNAGGFRAYKKYLIENYSKSPSPPPKKKKERERL